jgi:hypothetical protein
MFDFDLRLQFKSLDNQWLSGVGRQIFTGIFTNMAARPESGFSSDITDGCCRPASLTSELVITST